MEDIWLTKLGHHAVFVQKTSENVCHITKHQNFDEQRAQIALQLVRDGQSAFQTFSNEIREADLSSSYYGAAAEVGDAWTDLVQLLKEKLRTLQAGELTSKN